MRRGIIETPGASRHKRDCARICLDNGLSQVKVPHNPYLLLEKFELGRPNLNHRTAISRYLCLSLALFVFTVTAFVHLTHSKTDFQSSACEPASYASSDAQNDGDRQPCLACMIVKAFQTAQVVLFLLLLCIATLLSGSCQPDKSEFHSIPILSRLRVRGPPAFALPL